MKQTNQNFLAEEKIGRLMGRYAVPCIISLLVGALYNIVDQIFIANADYLGSFGNAANTVVFPLTVVALAMAVMLGDGCCALALPMFFGLDGVLYSMPASDILTTIISAVLIVLTYKQLKQQSTL